MYHGWSDCDGPEDCNVKDDFIFDARFNRQEVMDMMVSMHDSDRRVEIWKCECISTDETSERQN